jgi:hypothetical protein
VTRHGFSVFLQATYRNTFQTRALGRFLREDGWTRVDVHFGMDPVAGLFPKIWVGALLAMLIFFLCVPGMLASAPAGVWFILAPIFMMPFGPAMQVYGRWVARDEERKLRELLPRILESTENPTA